MQVIGKIVGWSLLAIALAYIVLINFSTDETRYLCNSKYAAGPDLLEQQNVYLKLEKYKWWIGLWSDSGGSLWVEVPSQHIEYFPRLVIYDEIIGIYDQEGSLRGDFSTLSGALIITTYGRILEGKCTRIEQGS